MLLALWYPLMKATSVIKEVQGCIPPPTIAYALSLLIHHFHPGGLRKDDRQVFLERFSDCFHASRVTASASDQRKALVPGWYCQFFPKILAGLTEDSAFSCKPLPASMKEATAAFEAGFPLPRHLFPIW